MRVLMTVLLTAFSFGCSTGPEPIVFGKDQCAFCKMTIADPGFGGELVTDKGRIYKFDATECMVDYVYENDIEFSDKLVIAFDDPKKLHPVDSLSFVIDEKYKSPMGANLAAFRNRNTVKIKHPQFIQWEELKSKLRKN